MTTAAAVDRPPAPASVVWLADRWRRADHVALFARVVAACLTVAVAALLAATPLWLPETGYPSAPGASVPDFLADPDPQRWFGLVATCAGLLGVAAVASAPRAPWLAWAAAVAPFAVLPVYGTMLASSWLALAGVAVVVATRRPWVAVVPWASAVASAVVWSVGFRPVLFPYGPGEPIGGPAGLPTGLGIGAYTTGAVLLAAWVGHVLRAAATRTRDAESTAHDARTAHAATTERTRLAHELHDVVAHHVSLVAVRAESAPFTVPDLDPRAAAAFAHIADDARTALTELRHVLTVLRRGDEAPLAPLTGDTSDLVAAARAAGQDVTVEGTWPDTDAGVGHVLHRAVQEGLTNARRHAPGTPVLLQVTDEPGLVGFRMSNRIDEGTASRPAHGLTGMRERVEALGGAVTTDVEDGTFVLVVSLPVDTP